MTDSGWTPTRTEPVMVLVARSMRLTVPSPRDETQSRSPNRVAIASSALRIGGTLERNHAGLEVDGGDPSPMSCATYNVSPSSEGTVHAIVPPGWRWWSRS